MDREAWQGIVHRVAKSQTQLSNTFTYTEVVLIKYDGRRQKILTKQQEKW